MNYRSLSIRNKMLIVLLPLLLGMVIVGMFIINRLNANALDKNINATLRNFAVIAASSARTGLEFEDSATVAEAMQPFTGDEQLSYLRVTNSSGKAVYSYRKPGFADIQPKLTETVTRIGEEVFTSSPIKSGQDELGQVVLGLSLADRNAALRYAQRFLIVLTVIGIVILFAAVILLGQTITRPVRELVTVAQEISEGNLQQQIPVSGNDEIGQLAAAFNSVLHYIQEIATNADSVSQGDLTGQVQVRSDKDILSLSFNRLTQQLRQVFGNILNFTDTLSNTAEKLKRMSQHLAGDSQDMRQASDMVASATEEMKSNIQTVEANIQEMNNTIEEIARNTERANMVTQQAVATTEDANLQITSLNKTAQEINSVIETITDIAGQTKLLALNATIEAARAGEAGKGFAVVANEVKDLAQQTNKATEEINSRLKAMQSNTGEAVRKIGQVGEVINEVNEMVATIAAAVEEQSATTREVAQSIVHTSQVASSINEDMQKFRGTSEVVEQNSTELQQDANGFIEINKNLLNLIKKFKL